MTITLPCSHVITLDGLPQSWAGIIAPHLECPRCVEPAPETRNSRIYRTAGDFRIMEAERKVVEAAETFCKWYRNPALLTSPGDIADLITDAVDELWKARKTNETDQN